MATKHCTFTVNGHRYEIPSGAIPHYLTVYDYLVKVLPTAEGDNTVSTAFPAAGPVGSLARFHSLKRCSSAPSGGGNLSCIVVVSESRTMTSSSSSSTAASTGGGGGATIVVTAATGMIGGGTHVLHRPVDACTTPILSLHGCAITTLEGLCSPLPSLSQQGAPQGGAPDTLLCQVGGALLHPVAARFAAAHASPCGYCAPGICMLLYALLLNNPQPTTAEIDAALAGVWCRCSGFRAVLDAAHSFSSDIDQLLRTKTATDSDAFAANSLENYPPLSEHGVRREVVTSMDRIALLRKLFPAYPHQHFKPPMIPTDPPLPIYFGSDGTTFLQPGSVDDVVTSSKIAPDYTTFAGAEDFHSLVLSRVARPEGPPLALLYNGRVVEMHEISMRDTSLSDRSSAAAAVSSSKDSSKRGGGGGTSSSSSNGPAADSTNSKKPANFSLFIGAAATFSSIVSQIPKLMHVSDVAQRDPWMATALLELRQAIEQYGDSWVDQQNNTLVSHLLARPCGDLVPILQALNAKLIALTAKGRVEFTVVEVSSASRSLGKTDVILGLTIPSQPNRFVCYEKATLRDRRAPAQVAVGLACDVGRATGNASSDIVATNFSVSIAGSSFYLITLGEVESALEKTNLSTEVLRTFRGGLDKLLTTMRNMVHGPSDGRVSYRIAVARGLLFRILNRLLLSLGLTPIDASAIAATQPLFYGGGGGGGGANGAGSPTAASMSAAAESSTTNVAGLLGASTASAPLPKSPRRKDTTAGSPTRASTASIASAIPPVSSVHSWEVASGNLFRSSMEPLELQHPNSDLLARPQNSSSSSAGAPSSSHAAGKGLAAAKAVAANQEGLHSNSSAEKSDPQQQQQQQSPDDLLFGASFWWSPYFPIPSQQTDRSPVGDPSACVRGPRHFSALTEYVGDRPAPRGLLHAWFVRSTIPKGVIKQVNTTGCKSIPGFLAYLDVRDVPEGGQDHAPSHLSSRTATKSLEQCAWWEHPSSSSSSSSSEAQSNFVFPGFQVFSDRNVEYVGELIGMVVATTPLAAKRAAQAVTMEYVKDHRVAYCLSIAEAREARAYFPPTSEGGTAAAFTTAASGDPFVEIVAPAGGGGNPSKGAGPVAIRRAMENPQHKVLQGSFSMGGQYAVATEPICIVAEPGSDGASMFVEGTAESASSLQQAVARFLQLPVAAVSAKVRQLGGSYGSRHRLPCILAAAVALAAWKLRRPVSYQGSLEEDWVSEGKSPAAVCEWRCAYQPSADPVAIQALEMTFYLNAGAKAYDSARTLRHVLDHATGAYCIPNVRLRGALCKTNYPPATATRGFGAQLSTLAMEQVMESVARAAQVPRWRLQAAHLVKPNDVLPCGQVARQVRLQTTWDDLLISSNVGERMLRAEQYNGAHRWRKRGIAVLPLLIGAKTPTGDATPYAYATVTVHVDGSVRVELPAPDCGNGLTSKMVQLVCRALHTTASMCTVTPSVASDSLPVSLSGQTASMSVDLVSNAVLDACEQLAKRFGPLREEFPRASLGVLCRVALTRGIPPMALGKGTSYVSLSSLAPVEDDGGPTTTTTTKPSSSTLSEPYAYHAAGAASCEVELDILTGQHRILRADLLVDAGLSLNPHLDAVLLESAFLQGAGWATTEEVVCGDSSHPDVPEGSVYNVGVRSYTIPRLASTPTDFRIAMVGGSINERRSVHGAKASLMEDCAVALGSVVFSALRDAIAAARSHWTVEHALPLADLAAPLTAERVRMACFDEFTQATHSGAECTVAGSF